MPSRTCMCSPPLPLRRLSQIRTPSLKPFSTATTPPIGHLQLLTQSITFRPGASSSPPCRGHGGIRIRSRWRGSPQRPPQPTRRPVHSRRAITGTAIAALVAVAIGIVISYVIPWFPVQASTQAHNTDRLYHVLVIASIPIFVLVVTVILFCVVAVPHEAGRGAQGRSRRSTATPAWRSSGRRSPRCCCWASWATPSSCSTTTKRSPAREIQVGRDRPAVHLVLPVPHLVTGGAPLDSYQLYVPEGRVGLVQHPLQGRDPRLLHPGLPPAGGRGPRHHHPLSRDPDRLGTYPVSATCSAASGTR